MERSDPGPSTHHDANAETTRSAFLPLWVKERIEAAGCEVVAPTAERWNGSMLQVDVTGFTALTERWSALGAEGSEKSSRVLNRYVGRLIDTIVANGGDVVGFAGDAVLAMWRSDARLASASALQAVRAALEVRDQMREVEASGDTRLALRSAIVSGTFHAMLLGGHQGRWHPVVVGDPMKQLDLLLAGCRAGEVALCDPTYQLVERDVVVVRGAAGWTATSVTGSPELRLAPRRAHCPTGSVRLRDWIPVVIADRLAAGQTAWLSELRYVTVAFARLPLAFPVSQASLAVLQTAVQSLQRYIEDAGGSVNKICADEKGVALVAAFGLPPAAHEDDPVRCVRAAMAMVRGLRSRHARLPIGVATGRVFCGVVGSHVRCEYTVIGSPVNLAARLMAMASDDVLCDHETAQACSQRLRFDGPEEARIKGFPRPMRIYRATAATLQPTPSTTPIVGRLIECALLSTQFTGLLREQRSATLVVRGDPGIGKSRLTDELSQRAQAEGIRVLHARADPLEATTAYHVWRPILADLFRVDDDQSRQRTRQLALAHLADLSPHATAHAALLNAVMPLGLPETAETRALSGEGRAVSTQHLVLQLLARAALARPTLLVLEDGHWFDSASWALLQLVVSRVEPLLTLVVTRPILEPVIDEFRWLLAQDAVTTLDLGPLPPRDALTLASQQLGVQTLPDEVGALIAERGAGNPLFIEELAMALRDAGAVQVAGGVCELVVAPEALASLDLPRTLQGLILSRFDCLAPETQSLMKVASVLGRHFDERVLRAVYAADDEGSLAAGLAEALESALIRVVSRGSEPSYAFRHALTRDAVYGLMLFAQRRRLHHDVADWFKDRIGAGRGQSVGLVAFHYTLAQAWQPAVLFLATSADRAFELYSNREAAALYEQLFGVVADHGLAIADEQRLRWRLRLAESCFRLGDIVGCRRHGLLAMRLSGNPVPTTVAGQLLGIARGVGLRLLQRWLPSLFHVGDAAERERRLALTRNLNRLTEAAIYAEDALSCLDLGLRELNMAEPSGPSPELGRAYALMAVVLGTIPLHRISQAWTARALVVSEPAGETVELAYALSRVGVYEIYIAEWHRSEVHLRRSIAMATSLGARRLVEECLVVQGLTLFYSGRLQAPLSLWAESRRSARLTSNAQTLAWTHIADAGCLIRMGHSPEALNALNQIEPWVLAHGTRTERILVHGLLSLALARTHDYEAAHARANAALVLVSGRPPVAYWMQHAVAAVCQTYLLLWVRATEEDGSRERVSDLRRQSRSALVALRWFALVFPFGQAHAALWAGHHAWLAGQPQAARRRWRQAASRAERAGQPYEQGLALRALGASSAGDERQAHLRRAIALLAGTGASESATEAERLTTNNAGPSPLS